MMQNLTSAQIDLLCNLARLKQEGRLYEPIRPIPTEADQYVVYLRGNQNFFFKDFGDIDALCVVGLLDYDLTRMGTAKLFRVSKLGMTLYESGELSAEIALEQIDHLHKATSELKIALGTMLAGEALSRALAEITFVESQLGATHRNHTRTQTALQRLHQMIGNRFHFVSLDEAVQASAAFGDWARILHNYLNNYNSNNS